MRVQLAGTNYLSIAEVQVWTGSSTPQVQWLISDHLGTPRMVLDHAVWEELVAPTHPPAAAALHKAIQAAMVSGTNSPQKSETLKSGWIIPRRDITQTFREDLPVSIRQITRPD